MLAILMRVNTWQDMLSGVSAWRDRLIQGWQVKCTEKIANRYPRPDHLKTVGRTS